MSEWKCGNYKTPSLLGLILGIFLGLSPLEQAGTLPVPAIWTLGLGLGGTYLSIGILVGLLPAPDAWIRSRWRTTAFGAMVGLLYSVPGSFFTMVPYPLAEDAAPYFREFVSGGWRAFSLTLGFGAMIGGICGLGKKQKLKN